MTNMAPEAKKNEFEIDCQGRRLGRVATEIASILMGKNTPEYSPEKDIRHFVRVSGVGKLEFSGNKAEAKTYFRHTGYPGGIREESLKSLFSRNPQEVLRRAVSGMLPKNKLRSRRIGRLKFQ